MPRPRWGVATCVSQMLSLGGRRASLWETVTRHKWVWAQERSPEVLLGDNTLIVQCPGAPWTSGEGRKRAEQVKVRTGP